MTRNHSLMFDFLAIQLLHDIIQLTCDIARVTSLAVAVMALHSLLILSLLHHHHLAEHINIYMITLLGSYQKFFGGVLTEANSKGFYYNELDS